MEERGKTDSTPPPHRPIILYEGHTSAKKYVAKIGFKMIHHPIIALLAHMGGYMLRKTFVETSFRMNTLMML